MRQLARLRQEVESWRALKQRAKDALELACLQDESLQPEIEAEAAAIEEEIGRRELAATLSGPYDRDNAILAIHAGAGGTDSQDWAAMLQRMYLRWAEKHGFQTEVLDLAGGEEAGIKSTTISVNGDYAYGYLRLKGASTAWSASRPSTRLTAATHPSLCSRPTHR